jgi:hypothetical protein
MRNGNLKSCKKLLKVSEKWWGAGTRKVDKRLAQTLHRRESIHSQNP